MKNSNIKTDWDFGLMFETDNDPAIEKQLKAYEEESYKFINKWKEDDRYLKEVSVLKEALDEYEALMRDYGFGGNAGYYFWLKTQKYSEDSNIKARFNQIDELESKISSDLNFFTIRLSKVSSEKQKEFLGSDLLADYNHFLERLFVESKYLLSEKEEKILTLKSSVSHSNWVKMVSILLSKEERSVLDNDEIEKVKSFSEICSLSQSKNKKVRDFNANVVNEILEKHSDVAEHELNSVLMNKKVDDELRGIERPDLVRYLSDDMETETVDLMSKVVADNFEIAKRFYELKAKLLGVERLEYHERNVAYGDDKKEYSYEDALEMVRCSLNNLDEEFAKILDEFSEKGHIDVFPLKGKRDGAFCSYSAKSSPVFIMLNHNKRLNDVLTLAHEVGHGINDILMQRKQNALNFGTPTSTAEVASTFFEDFVLDEILKEADDELRLVILMQKLNGDVSTIFRQISCFSFEKELHKQFREKGYLSKKEIGELFQKYMKSYMGDFVEQSVGSENWWVYWSHIRSFFYNYTYAGGLLISKSLQKSVKENPKFIEKVKEFLSAGTSESPKDIFKKLGVDIEDKKFWENGVGEVKELLDETWKLAEKLGKI